ncbi:hypothetical protein Tco_0863178 [Tanacetum coccineum]
MENENHIRTLGDYSKPSHEGYRNTIELPIGNKVVPLRSDTIRLVQNGCSFHGLRSEDPNQHLKDFLKFVDSLDLDVGSITTWEDLITRFLAQFFSPGRTAKLRNDIMICPEYIRPPPHGAQESSSTLDGSSSFSDTTYLNKAGGKWYTFKPEQNNLGDTYNPSWKSHPNLRLSKFEADFKQQQSEMTNKIDRLLNAITDRMAGALLSDTVKNPKLNVNITTLILSARPYPTVDL